MKKNIAIVGAFDRYNYGDLLFPIIIELYLKNAYEQISNEYNINYYAIEKSNLSMYGGKPTKSISELFIDNNMPENSILIVSGGEVLPARLSNMCWDSENSRIILIIKKAIRKISGIQLYENSLKRKLNIYNNFPWVFGKKDFCNDVKILYNSVGGASLEDLNIQELDNIKNKLKTSDYLSVRDNKTVYNLKEINPRLAPDSATIMSEFFTIDILKNKVSNPIEKFVSKNNGKYICIQSNLDSIKGKEDILVKQLEKIYIKYNYNIVLLPIGIATNHDDGIALKKIKDKLRVPHFLPNNLKIYDIMYLIANSIFFAGTSLHGNITAMSYAIPHIGLNTSIRKLDEYLKTWDISEQRGCIEFDDLFGKFTQLINLSNDIFYTNKEKLVNLSRENFENMFSKVFIKNK